jgi:hypothetical protein
MKLTARGVLDSNGAEFEGVVARWSDGDRDAFTLVYNDRKADNRGGSNCAYHIVMSKDKAVRIEGVLKSNPEDMIALFRTVFSSADRSEGTLSVIGYVDLGDMAKPRQVEQRPAYVQPSRQPQRGTWLGRLGLGGR